MTRRAIFEIKPKRPTSAPMRKATKPVLPLVEEAIAGGARRNALAHEFRLGFQSQVTGRSPGGDDERVAGVFGGVALEPKGALLQVHRLDVVECDLGLETLGVFLESLHQFRALNALTVRGPVVHVGGGHQLSARSEARDEEGLQVGARRVDRGGITRGAGAQNQQAGVSGRF